MLSPSTSTDFITPSWTSPLDGQAALRAVPEGASIAGMFLEPMAEAAREAGRPLPSARPRYTGFNFYPLEEHVKLLLEASDALFPGKSTRIAMRKLGRAATNVMLSSTLGRVTVGAASDVPGVLSAMAKIFSSYLRPCRVEVVGDGSNSLVVSMSDVHYFLDCHHVGVWEGAMRYAGVDGKVEIREYSTSAADMRCSW